MEMSEDPYYIVLRDICRGELKRDYPFEANEILSVFEKRKIALKENGRYSPTEKGVDIISRMHEQIWYKTVETSLL